MALVNRLGDAGFPPDSRTGAAIRKQAHVVLKSLQAVMAGRKPAATYAGYASRLLTTLRNWMLLPSATTHTESAPGHPSDQHEVGVLRHVAAQAVRAPVPVLESHAQGPALIRYW